MCKANMHLSEAQSGVLTNDTNRECLSTRWEIVQKHSVNIVSKSVNTMSCLLCKKIISHDEYQIHMNHVHSRDKFCICPICGYIKK